jgi:homogentisate 1,2-dioxygenase
MPTFLKVGDVPRKRFSQFRREDGALYCTEVMGLEGFSSDFSLLHHRHPPASVLRCEAVQHDPVVLVDNHPLQPQLWHTARVETQGDLVSGRLPLCGNDDVLVGFAAADRASALYRNAVADELLFVHEGSARLESVFGTLDVGAGDYVLLPKGVTHRWVPTPSLRALVFETSGHVKVPARYLSAHGQFLQTAPFSELDLRAPVGPLLVDEGEVDVLVRTRAGLTRYTCERHPFDVVGWFGCNYPFAFNVADFSPITGSFHRPPPVHQVFEAPQMVFCNFVPRMLDYDPRAMPIPSFHSNVDSDELIFYAEGNFFSRRGSGIERGSLTLHPAGHVHGPHPGSMEKAAERVGQRTEETAIMLDTFRPLRLARRASALQQAGYLSSWTAPASAGRA